MANPLVKLLMGAGAIAEPTPFGEMALMAALAASGAVASKQLGGMAERGEIGLSNLNIVMGPDGRPMIDRPSELQPNVEDSIISQPRSQGFVESLTTLFPRGQDRSSFDGTTSPRESFRSADRTQLPLVQGPLTDPVIRQEGEQPKGEIVGKTFYHGTKAPITDLSEADPVQFGKVSSIYGEGLYLTDNPDVAKGYAQRKGKGEAGKVLETKINVNENELLNLDNDLPQDVLQYFNGIRNELTDESFSSTTGTKVYEELREIMADSEITTSEATEIFQDISNQLWQFGYKGLKHTGGKIIKAPTGEHNVVILFQDPFSLKIDALNSKR